MMTPSEFRDEMAAIVTEFGSTSSILTDNEELHIAVDDLMRETLMSLGYGDGVALIPKGFWYFA